MTLLTEVEVEVEGVKSTRPQLNCADEENKGEAKTVS